MNKSISIAASVSLISSIGTAQNAPAGLDLNERVAAEEQKTISSHPAEDGDWIRLFNGKDLSGWTPKIRGHEAGDNYADTFRVEDGVLKVSYDQYTPEDSISMDGKKSWDKFGHLFYNESFSHYLLRVEYRFVGEQIENGPAWALRNNGVMIHGQTVESMELMQKFPASLEVQLLAGNGTDYRPNLNLCTPGTHVVMSGELIKPHVINSSSATYHGDRWVEALIEVRGNEVIRHWVDGRAVIEYSKPQFDPISKMPVVTGLIEGRDLMIDRGTISIQSESHPTEFRRIDLKKLDPAPRPALGNWAMVMPDGAAGWLSLSELGATPKGELWTVGSPKPLANVKLAGSQLSFMQKRAVGKPEFVGGPPTGKKISCQHRATVSGDLMEGVIEVPMADGSLGELRFTGKRMPSVPPRPDLEEVKFGEPIDLFNGKNLDGWRLSNPKQKNMWKAEGGELVNETPKKSFDPYARYGNLRSDREFMDFKLHIEFKIPEGGNSGVYLRGAYEAQVVDRDSRMQGLQGVGAIFGRIAPSEKAGKVGGEWQSYDITLVDRHVTVVLNGVTVIDNQPLAGPTNGGTQADELKPGPIFLQGDHTSVSYRNIKVWPVVEPEK